MSPDTQKNQKLRRLLYHGATGYELVGTVAGREFSSNHGYHEGKIECYFPVEDFYRIVYEDGDGEDLTLKELEAYCEQNQ